jgi:hypothetical protein
MLQGSLASSLGKCTAVFQAEVYATEACPVENLGRGYIVIGTSIFYQIVKLWSNHLTVTRPT